MPSQAYSEWKLQLAVCDALAEAAQTADETTAAKHAAQTELMAEASEVKNKTTAKAVMYFINLLYKIILKNINAILYLSSI